MSDLREQLLRAGWHQGSIIEAGAIGDPILSGGDAFLILNQTCDLVSGKLEDEPHAELLPLQIVARMDSRMTNGRNPRRIHFALEVEGRTKHVEAFAVRRVLLPRERLAGCDPSARWVVKRRVVDDLIAWFARRYLRTAFPEAFERRFVPIVKPFRKALKGCYQYISSFLIRIDPFAEIHDTGEPYEIDLILVVERAVSDDAAKLFVVQNAAHEIERRFNSQSGFMCHSCVVLGLHEITLERRKAYLDWDRYDYLSFGEES